MTKNQLKKEIFKKIKQYYQLAFKQEFVPGQTSIQCSAKVFDEQEMILLADSALDFWLTEGRFAKQFEKNFCEYMGARYTVLTNSGSSANLLAFATLTSPKLGERSLQPGDEVIATASTFPTTVNPIIQYGCVPVFIDINLKTLNIDVGKIENAITKKTKAIFLAHILGNPFDLGTVMRLARKYNLWVIEDACDALGSTYNNKLIGTFGDLASFSFYPAHHMTMGEGGAVITNNSLLKIIVRSFRDWGRDCWCDTGRDNACKKRFSWKLGRMPFGYDHKFIYSHIGYNLKLTDMQAAIGVAQLKKLPEFIKKRKQNFQSLYKKLEPFKNYFILPQAQMNSDPSWFGFPLTIKRQAGFKRKELVEFLEQHKIVTRMATIGNITRQPCFTGIKYRTVDALKNSNYALNNSFWIGLYPGIGQAQIQYVAEIFTKFINEKNLNHRLA